MTFGKEHRVKKWLFCVVILLLALPSMAQEEDNPSPFTVVQHEPVVEHGPRGEWDGKYTDPGAVIFHDGQFHLFRNGFPNWPARVGVAYHTSDDGVNWTEFSDEPVFDTVDVPYAELAILAHSILVEDDGTWVMYFTLWNGRPGTDDAGSIGRATADSPTGLWTPDDEPILLPAGGDAWDSSQVIAPAVFQTDEGYTMYYSGTARNQIQQIGMATSDDGINWTKYDDPETTDDPYAESDPIFVSDADWENNSIHQPRVVQLSSGKWLMIYRGNTQSGSQMQLGLAFSEDGLNWTKFDGNPIFHASDVDGGSNFWFHSAVVQNDTLYVYVEIGPNRNVTETNIFLITAELDDILP